MIDGPHEAQFFTIVVMAVASLVTLLVLRFVFRPTPDGPVSSLTRREVERILEEAINGLEKGEAPKTRDWEEFLDGHFEDLGLELAQYRCWAQVLKDERNGPIDDLQEAAEELRTVLKELRTYDNPL